MSFVGAFRLLPVALLYFALPLAVRPAPRLTGSFSPRPMLRFALLAMVSLSVQEPGPCEDSHHPHCGVIPASYLCPRGRLRVILRLSIIGCPGAGLSEPGGSAHAVYSPLLAAVVGGRLDQWLSRQMASSVLPGEARRRIDDG